MARMLIAGCGETGAALGLLLAREGNTVFGLRRRPELLPEGIHPLEADLTVRTSLSLPPGLDTVFSMAAADAFSETAYHKTYLEGTRNLLEALTGQAQPLRRVFFISSTAVYSQMNGEWVDETSPARPASFSGKTILGAEHLVLESGLPATVVRFGGIYGPNGSRLIDLVLEGRTALLEGPPVYTNRIHRLECARVLAHLAKLDAPGKLFLGVDHEPCDQREVLRWLAKRLGKTFFSETGQAEDRRRRSQSNKRCRNRRLLNTGYEFQYPTYREGYAAILKKMGLKKDDREHEDTSGNE